MSPWLVSTFLRQQRSSKFWREVSCVRRLKKKASAGLMEPLVMSSTSVHQFFSNSARTLGGREEEGEGGRCRHGTENRERIGK